MEKKEENDLFFVCSFIEYIARITKNKKKNIINYLGIEKIKKLLDLADIYHTENIEKIANEIIEEKKIPLGNYKITESNTPSYFDIGRVYQRLILNVNNNKKDYAKTLSEVLSSWIIEKIDNYNTSLYYENPSYIYECYKAGKILD